MATMNTAQTVYQGPGTNYGTVGSVTAGTTVTFVFKELPTTWAMIEYAVTGTKYKRRGYVPFLEIKSPGTKEVTVSLSTRYVIRGCVPFFGPSNKGYSETDDITRGSQVKYTGYKENSYALVEYGTKRFWMYDMNLGDSAPTGNDSKSLAFSYNFNQKDSTWSELNPKFADTGCAVCSAADVASFVEGTSLNPSVMKDRNVFTSTDMNCKWVNASSKCDWRGLVSPTNYLDKIKHRINSELPVIILLKSKTTSNTHWVVAYGFANAASATSDVLVKDPWDSTVTKLSESMNTRNYTSLMYIHLY